MLAHDLARERDGRFLLRIEDIDGVRSRPELAEEFRADLRWLGLDWTEVPAQSTRLSDYAAAADRLRQMGLLYRCTCTRAQIATAATHGGPDGPVYPGTCRRTPPEDTAPAAWRLNVREAMRRTGPLKWTDDVAGEQSVQPDLAGDVVLVRKDDATPASYHLAATIDDATDGVTLVTRGIDLFAATHVHRLLQELLDLPVPRWHHHALLVDEAGRKLAKRRNSPSLADRRRAGEDGAALARALTTDQLPAGITLSRSLDTMA